jgi:amino-acid N-acetyltransferase
MTDIHEDGELWAWWSDRATVGDVAAIGELIDRAWPQCLPLSRGTIFEHLDEFFVLRNYRGETIATAALHDLGDGRAELRALAVDEACRGRGLGSRLVRRLILVSLARGQQLVCVTRAPGFFRSLGFREIPLDSLPAKPDLVDEGAAGRRVALEWTWAPGARHGSQPGARRAG